MKVHIAWLIPAFLAGSLATVLVWVVRFTSWRN